MFSWPDVVATLGFVALAILGGKLGVLPEKLVVALVTAAVGYFGARTALAKLGVKKDDAKKDQRSSKKSREREEGAPEEEIELQASGVIEVSPQKPGRIVKVNQDGSVHIGPAPGTDYAHDPSDTPPDGVPPVHQATGTDDEE